jgi:kynurenine formamidase
MQSGWFEHHMRLHERIAEARSEPPGQTSDDPRAVSRRGFLQAGIAAGAAVGMAANGLIGSPPAVEAMQPAQQGDTPIGPTWWPSRWGPEDEAGASNWITPDKVLQAARLIRTGQIFELGRIYEQAMPQFGARVWALRIPGAPTGGPFGANRLVYHDEFVATEIGQVGTQFDGLGHIGCQVGAPGDQANMRYYNGFTELQIANANGLQKLGIEKLKPIFTRAVLADIAGLKGRMLELGEEVTVADTVAALNRVGIGENSIQPGDAVFFNTGWGRLWMVDNATFLQGGPGPGLEVARWLASKDISVFGGDHWATEVVPNPDPNLAFIVHNELITKHGILNHENLDFTEVIGAGAFEFVYVMTPLRMKGATGSPGRPIAIT